MQQENYCEEQSKKTKNGISALVMEQWTKTG